MAEEKKKTYLAYEVKFENGKPVLSETAYQTLLYKGWTEDEIRFRLDNLSQAVIERGLKSTESRIPQVISY